MNTTVSFSGGLCYMQTHFRVNTFKSAKGKWTCCPPFNTRQRMPCQYGQCSPVVFMHHSWTEHLGPDPQWMERSSKPWRFYMHRLCCFHPANCALVTWPVKCQMLQCAHLNLQRLNFWRNTLFFVVMHNGFMPKSRQERDTRLSKHPHSPTYSTHTLPGTLSSS